MRAKPLANLPRGVDGQHFILEFLLQSLVGEGSAQGLLAGPSVLKPRRKEMGFSFFPCEMDLTKLKSFKALRPTVFPTVLFLLADVYSFIPKQTHHLQHGR